MALWMEPGQEAFTEAEKADLDAIEALRESAALELKEEGNGFLRKGKQSYADALDCYTRAINKKCANDLTNSVLFANRAQVNILLENFGRALSDAEEAIRRNPENLKAFFRGAKASLALDLLSEAGRFCTEGLCHDSNNEELKKIQRQIEKKTQEDVEKKKRAKESQLKTEALATAVLSRKVKLGELMYKELCQGRKPWLDSTNILHWPVLLLYGEAMTSDFIEDFCEIETFAVHLDEVFGGHFPPLVWDERHEYTRDRIALYYWANAGVPLTKRKLMDLLSENEVGYERSLAEDDENDDTKIRLGKPHWVKVNERETLHSVLSRGNHIIPGIPVFYVVATGTSFCDTLTSGQWCP